jgi:flagellar motor protein MotB
VVEEKRKAMLDDVGELLDESKPRLLKIQVDGHVDGDSETTTETKEQKSVSGN